jgi:hypothetical protein
VSGPLFPQFNDEALPDPAASDAAPDAPADHEGRTPYRGERNDPIFGYLIAVAVSLGTAPFLPEGADLRYTLAWGTLAAFGVLAWLLGTGSPIGEERPENLGWGLVLGVILSAPLLGFASAPLTGLAKRLFLDVGLGVGTVAAFVVFVWPLGETLFFRGLMQQAFPWWAVVGLATLWNLILFFPLLDVGNFPAPAALTVVILLMQNVLYSYVRARNGLAATWFTQITCNVLLLVVPSVVGG